MCLNPITIVNPTKYISLKHPDRYLLQVPCCKCAECQQVQSNQWFYRAWYEFRDIMQMPNSFVQFDTLTYSNRSLPYISDFVDVPNSLDFSCFNPRHWRQFVTNLNTQVARRYKKRVSFRYFMSSEYGSEQKTFRPHYHVLFFVHGAISPVEWSRLVAELWSYGRTDGSPYKSDNYVNCHNTIKTNHIGDQLRVTNYVIKYVQKSCMYDKKLSTRLNAVMRHIARVSAVVPDFEDTFTYTLIKESINRHIGQFHRQSQHFGESALADIDLIQLTRDGCLYMPHNQFVKVPVPLPTYYRRKLFYELVVVDGVRAWQDTELGRVYKQCRRKHLIKQTQDRFQSWCIQFNLDFDCERLAKYVHLKRGRIIADNVESTLEERYNASDLFNYVTRYDKEALHDRGLTNQFVGNSVLGYNNSLLPKSYTIRSFIEKYVYTDAELENQLAVFADKLKERNAQKQDAFALKQRLLCLFKDL